MKPTWVRPYVVMLRSPFDPCHESLVPCSSFPFEPRCKVGNVVLKILVFRDKWRGKKR